MGDVTFAPRAIDDLREIGRYTFERWGAIQQDDYLDQLETACDDPPRHANRGQKRNDLKKGLLSIFCGSHTICFRRQSADVKIIRIPGQRQSVAKAFNP